MQSKLTSFSSIGTKNLCKSVPKNADTHTHDQTCANEWICKHTQSEHTNIYFVNIDRVCIEFLFMCLKSL